MPRGRPITLRPRGRPGPRPFELPEDDPTWVPPVDRHPMKVWTAPKPPGTPGRACAEPGCRTILSRWNDEPTCFLHQEVHVPTKEDVGVRPTRERRTRTKHRVSDEEVPAAMANAKLMLRQGARPDDVARITGLGDDDIEKAWRGVCRHCRGPARPGLKTCSDEWSRARRAEAMREVGRRNRGRKQSADHVEDRVRKVRRTWAARRPTSASAVGTQRETRGGGTL